MELSGFHVESLNKTTVLKDVGDGYLLIVGPIDEDGSQTEPITIKRTVPDMDFYTVSENRLWGCSSKNHEIYASKLGSFRNFHCFDGVSSDSYTATIASDGDFTGAITYLGYVMFWKENAVYKVYGNRPSNFQIVEGMLRGVAKGCGKSLCIVNEVLYYKSESSVMSFQGALPTDVGAVLEAGYGEAEAGRMGNKYYISMEMGFLSTIRQRDYGTGRMTPKEDIFPLMEVRCTIWTETPSRPWKEQTKKSLSGMGKQTISHTTCRTVNSYHAFPSA